MLSAIFEQIINGIVSGSVYAIVAVGMTMIFGVLRAINFAHGEYYMLGTFGAWFAIEYFDLSYPASIVIGVIATAIIAFVVGRFVMQRIVGAPAETGVLATLGIALVLQNTVILVFGGGYKFFSGGYIEPISIFGFTLAEQRVLIIIVCLLVFVGLELMVTYSRMGKAMRAVSQNIECCAVVGIDVSQVALRTFILGACLAALSGVLTAPVNVSVYGGMGELITFKTFPIIIMGGLGNVRGTFFAAMILGIAESLVATYVGLAVPRHRWIRNPDAGADVASLRPFLRASTILISNFTGTVRGQKMSPNDLSLPAPGRDLRLPFGVAFAAVACLAPLFLGNYALHAIIIALIFLLPAHGLNLLVGYTGLLSLAQAAFFGIGAYTSGLMAVHFGTPFYVNFVAAGLVGRRHCAAARNPGAEAASHVVRDVYTWLCHHRSGYCQKLDHLTRGDMGLSGIPKPYFALGPASFTVSGTISFYYLALIIAVLATLAVYLIVRSAAGRNMIAIRENETLAESVGIPTWRYKLVVFMISAAFAGFGGSVYAHYLTVVSPLTFQMYYSTTMLIIVLGGGAGTISGVIFGSLLFVGLSEALRVAPEVRMIAYGLCLLALVFWFPKGLLRSSIASGIFSRSENDRSAHPRNLRIANKSTAQSARSMISVCMSTAARSAASLARTAPASPPFSTVRPVSPSPTPAR